MKDEYLLEVKDLCKSYHQKEVLSCMQFGVHDGEILGFLGPNGAGKSTTIRLILGMEEANAGTILFCNHAIQPGSREFLKSVGYVPQEISVYSELSAYENVRFFCSLYGYHGEELRRRSKQALEFVKLWDHRKERPGSFSGGMKRRLNIACAIAHSPKLLIMDEPTVGIDPQSRNHIMEAIRTLNTEGTTIIYVSHYMEEIDSICKRIVIADHGKVIEDLEIYHLYNKYKEEGLETLEAIFLNLTGTALRDEQEVV